MLVAMGDETRRDELREEEMLVTRNGQTWKSPTRLQTTGAAFGTHERASPTVWEA